MDKHRFGTRVLSVAGVAALVIIVGLTIVGPGPADAGGKRFYVTEELFTGDQALTACAWGFRMASLWEIRDTTDLKYATNRGVVLPDSDDGPPTGVHGWIRTGYLDSATSDPGMGNCHAWTSASATDSGSVVLLPQDWTGNVPPTNISPWVGGANACNAQNPVWCVSK